MEKTNYVILLSLSENKELGGNNERIFRFVKNKKEFNYFMNNLWIEREKIYGVLRETISKSSLEKLEKTFKLKKNELKTTIEKNSDLFNSPTLSTLERDTSSLLKLLNYNNLNKKQKENFNISSIFLDALFGLLKPTDLIPEYNIKLDTKLIDLDIKKFWRENLTPVLTREFNNKLILNFLSKNFEEIISNTLIQKENFMKIEFKELKNKKQITLTGKENEKLKIELIKEILSKKEISLNFLKNFKFKNNFEYNNELSSKNKIVFLKK